MSAKGKVMIGMSGGVDSSVAALLLKEQGYEVVGVTFRLWSPDLEKGLGESSCCSVDDVNDAKFVCDALDIPHYVLNYKDLFRKTVVEYFIGEYERGATPNPCIACNRHIKFDAFLQKAQSMGFDYVATGHYANICQDPVTGRWQLRRGKFDRKDQSYVLYTLTQEQLAHTLMPIGDMEKEEVRSLARAHNLVVSGKPDSQDICFIPDGDYGRFLRAYTGRKPQPGSFIDSAGNILGSHRGIWNFTIGQRKGLGISFGKPMFVTAIDPVSNTVTLGENRALFCRSLIAEDMNWIVPVSQGEVFRVQAKIRYAHKPQEAQVTVTGNGAVVEFTEPQRAITPGQAVVFYDGFQVVGGGTIVGTGREE